MTELDATDWALVRALQDDARTSNRELAAAVHVSPSTSSERVRGLKADGVIRGYHADVDLGALGRHVQALTAITIRPPTREIIEAFRNWVVEAARDRRRVRRLRRGATSCCTSRSRTPTRSTRSSSTA